MFFACPQWGSGQHEVASLAYALGHRAYALGHSVKTLQELYERCTPEEKSPHL